MKKYVWWEDLDGGIYCPTCSSRCDVYFEDKGIILGLEAFEPRFCPKCGQELDWTESRSYGVEETH